MPSLTPTRILSDHVNRSTRIPCCRAMVHHRWPFMTAERLTAEAFAKFGEVLAPRETFGLGDTSEMMPAADGSRTTFGIVRFTAATSPLSVVELERHPHSKQTFVPLHGQRYLVVVAPDDASHEPDLNRLRAFVAADGQCITYGMGVWHSSMVALDRPSSFGVVMQKYAHLPETERRTLPQAVTIEFGD
jgi:ureidoglycolate lyase